MPDKVRFRCNNCGERFEAEVLDEYEKRRARDEGKPTSSVRCPKCINGEIRRGWD